MQGSGPRCPTCAAGAGAGAAVPFLVGAAPPRWLKLPQEFDWPSVVISVRCVLSVTPDCDMTSPCCCAVPRRVRGGLFDFSRRPRGARNPEMYCQKTSRPRSKTPPRLHVRACTIATPRGAFTGDRGGRLLVIKATVGAVPPIFTTGVKTKKGYTSGQSYGRGGTPNFHHRFIAKKGYTSDQGYGKGGTPNFHHRVIAKKGYTSDQGYGRGGYFNFHQAKLVASGENMLYY